MGDEGVGKWGRAGRWAAAEKVVGDEREGGGRWERKKVREIKMKGEHLCCKVGDGKLGVRNWRDSPTPPPVRPSYKDMHVWAFFQRI